jgi:hypothetical protein
MFLQNTGNHVQDYMASQSKHHKWQGQIIFIQTEDNSDYDDPALINMSAQKKYVYYFISYYKQTHEI